MMVRKVLTRNVLTRNVLTVLGLSALLIIVIFTNTGMTFTTEENNCTTSKCHTGYGNLKYSHAPVEDDCTTCHEKTGDHKFQMAEQGELCVQCHDEIKAGKKSSHEALDSDCTTCHNPHGSNYKALVKTERVSQVCFECHEQNSMNKKYIHGPMAAGNCGLCHNPHTSNFPKLLKTSREKICTGCHDDKEFSGKMKKHTPLENGCSGCHNPHSSANPYQLETPGEQICEQCHDQITGTAAKVKFKHPVLDRQKKCLNCHDAHGSKHQYNLTASQHDLCLGCHNKPIIGTDGKDYNIFNIVTSNPLKHGPVADGNCSGCHNPHGSDFYKILIKEYPRKFYTAYKRDKYALCFECHEDSIASLEETVTLTQFRDGKRNLHYLHVNKIKGRTCRSCHEIHAGSQPKLIVKMTPFGKWSLPIGFEKTEHGGSCKPGCHKPYTYNRLLEAPKGGNDESKRNHPN